MLATAPTLLLLIFLRLFRCSLPGIHLLLGTVVCFAVTVPLALLIRHYDCPDGGKRVKGCAADLLSGDVSIFLSFFLRDSYATLLDIAGFAAFYMFLGVIVSISALPVLARILTDFRILTTNLGPKSETEFQCFRH